MSGRCGIYEGPGGEKLYGDGRCVESADDFMSDQKAPAEDLTYHCDFCREDPCMCWCGGCEKPLGKCTCERDQTGDFAPRPKSLDQRHAHLALMVAVLMKPIPPSHEREWAIRDRLELAREILAEVEAQERKGAK